MSEVAEPVTPLAEPFDCAAVDDLLAALLRGDVPSFEMLDDPAAHAAFLDAAATHGVDCLVRHELKQRGLWSAVPLGIAASLDERARLELVLEAVRRREVTRVLTTFRAVGLETLVLKGCALAYTHYPDAYLRPRADTDLLVRKQDIGRTVTALGELGYSRINSVTREAVFTQTPFERYTGSVRHVIDLHWAISNRPLFAGLLSFDELVHDAIPVTALGDRVLTPGAVHALLLACIHRTAHHDDSDLMFWLYDIKLLANSLTSKEWDVFLQLAAAKRVAAVCHASLEFAAARVGCDAEALRRIGELTPSEHDPVEPSAAYLGVVGSGPRGMRLDLKATPGVAAKLRWVAGHMFPDAQYMRNAYGATSALTLAYAYVCRAAQGLWRVARRTRVN